MWDILAQNPAMFLTFNQKDFRWHSSWILAACNQPAEGNQDLGFQPETQLLHTWLKFEGHSGTLERLKICEKVVAENVDFFF